MKPCIRAICRCALLSFLLGLSSAMAQGSVDFFRAVGIDNAGLVSSMLSKGFDPNSVDEKGQVALYVALRIESPKVAAVLLAHPGLKVDASNDVNETPLMMAALRGSWDLARRMIELGAAVNRSGWTPLHYAASGPEARMVSLLLDKGANVAAQSPNKTTPLMMAARYGSDEMVKILLTRGADPKARNDQGLNPADFARLGGREDLAAQLDAAAR